MAVRVPARPRQHSPACAGTVWDEVPHHQPVQEVSGLPARGQQALEDVKLDTNCQSRKVNAVTALREEARPTASGTMSICRFSFGVYVHSYTRHSTTEEVLDDGLSGIPAEVADGAHARARPHYDPASLIRGGSALLETVSLELALPSRANGLEQASNELPQSKRVKLRALREHSISDNTWKNYLSQWRRFQRWAKENNVNSLPATPAQVEAYLEERFFEGHSSSTLSASRSAISYIHRAFEEDDPCNDQRVRATLTGATRLLGRTQKQAAALTREAFEKIRNTAYRPRVGKGGYLERPETALKRGRLDVAMIAMMRDGLLRVSEAADAVWGDIEDRPGGSGRLLIRRSKTDVEGTGFVAYLSAHTMSYLDEIRNGAASTCRVTGLRPNQIAKRIKQAAQQAGLGNRFSGHSCRVGMACDLAREDISLTRIMQAGRWTTAQMVSHYIRNEIAGRNAVAEYYDYRYRLD